MMTLSTFAFVFVILGILLIPRITFLLTWFFNTGVVAAVFGGNALLLAVFGFLFFPKVIMTYLLLESLAGAPTSGSALYWIYLGIALFFDIGTKAASSIDE